MEQPTPTPTSASIKNAQHLSIILFSLFFFLCYFIFLFIYRQRLCQRQLKLIKILAQNTNNVLNVDQQIHTLRVRIFEILFKLQFLPLLLSSNIILILIANFIFDQDRSKLMVLLGSPYTILLSIDLKMSKIALKHGVILPSFWQDRNESLIKDIRELQPLNNNFNVLFYLFIYCQHFN